MQLCHFAGDPVGEESGAAPENQGFGAPFCQWLAPLVLAIVDISPAGGLL